MPIFENGDVHLYYEEHGEGFPILLLAPGGMRSAGPVWGKAAPWNPIDQLSDDYRVIVMDQRNAGRSTAPVRATDSWHVYTQDQLALLDHLGVERCHLAGMCIGGPFIMGIIEAAPERVASAVVFQTIGLDEVNDNFHAFIEMFDGWAEELKPKRPDVDDAALESFRSNMFERDFLFNVSREFVSGVRTPLLVLMGNDMHHPEVCSRELAELAPNATLIERWKAPEDQPAAKEAVEKFLAEHTS